MIGNLDGGSSGCIRNCEVTISVRRIHGFPLKFAKETTIIRMIEDVDIVKNLVYCKLLMGDKD